MIISVASAYPILNALAVTDVYGLAFMAGIWSNMIFDPPQAAGTTLKNVAAVTFEVNCQALPNARQTSNVVVDRNSPINSVRFPFHVDDRLQDVEFSLGKWVARYTRYHSLKLGYQAPGCSLLVRLVPSAMTVNCHCRRF